MISSQQFNGLRDGSLESAQQTLNQDKTFKEERGNLETENDDLKTTNNNNNNNCSKVKNGLFNYSKNINQEYKEHFEDRLFHIQMMKMKNILPLLMKNTKFWNKNHIYDKTKDIGDVPKEYGIKSHIKNFYGLPDKDTLSSEEFMQGDDFQFLIEPRRKKSCWIRFSLWVGINFSLVGFIATIVGYLTPQQEIVIGELQDYIILDKWAAEFNNQIILCQLFGLILLACGSIIVFFSILCYSCEKAHKKQLYLMKATMLSQRFVEPPVCCGEPDSYWGLHCIPTSGVVRGVQPGYLKYNY